MSWSQSCFIVLVITLIVAGLGQLGQNPVALVLALVVVAIGILLIVQVRKSKDVKRLSLLEQQAQTLAIFAEGKFDVSDSAFAVQKDEVVILRLENVLLKEYRSSGSTFGGGYGGVSVPIFGSVRANVGGMAGGSKRKPEESTPIDVGVVTFTNQRIVFAGDNVVRAFDLDKIVNIETGDNGITLEIAVSNREKTSVLAANNMPELTPGMAASISLAWKEGGKEGAMKDAKDMHTRLLKAIADEKSGSK